MSGGAGLLGSSPLFFRILFNLYLFYIFRIKYQTPADKRNIVVIDLNRINNLSYDDKLFEISIDGMMVEKIVNTSTDIHKINITEMVDSNIKINDYFTPSLYEVLKSKIN